MGNCVVFKCTEIDENEQPEQSIARPTRRTPRKVPILKSPMDNQMITKRLVIKHRNPVTKESAENLSVDELSDENRNRNAQEQMKLYDQGTDLICLLKKASNTERTEPPWNMSKDIKIQGNHYRKSRGNRSSDLSNLNIKRLKSYPIYHTYDSLDYNFQSPASVECQ